MFMRKARLFHIVAVIVFLINLAVPGTAYADGETPTEVPASEPASAPVVDATAPEPPNNTDTTSVDAVSPVSPETTVDPLPADLPADANPNPTDVASPAVLDSAPAPTESPTLTADLPANTDVAVIDLNGQGLPLASQAAVDAVNIGGDPMWCPEGVDPGGDGCSKSYSTLSDLLDFANGFNIYSQGQDGVIWIEAGNYNSGAYISASKTAPSWDHNLTLLGGWSGNLGDTTANGTSTFNNNFYIDWGGNLTLKNITITGVDTTKSEISYVLKAQSEHGDILLENVTVEKTKGTMLTGGGARIFAAQGDVTIKDSHFDENHAGGALISNPSGNVLVSNSTFNDNGQYFGLGIGEMDGDITLMNITANGNEAFGADINDWGTGNVTISGVNQFSNNGYSGLMIHTSLGDTTISNVIANGNGFGSGLEGAEIYVGGNVSISDSHFDGNEGDGMYFVVNPPIFSLPPLETPPTIQLHNVTANGNGWDGLIFNNELRDMLEPATLTIDGCSTFNDNGQYGLDIANPNGSTFLNSVVVSGNDDQDFNISGPFTTGTTQCQQETNSTKEDHKDHKDFQYGIGNGDKFPLSCSDSKGLVLQLSDGNFVEFPCEVAGGVSSNTVMAGNLPVIPNSSVVSALNFQLYDPSKSYAPKITLGFHLPAGETGVRYSVLFWNGTQWVNMGGALSPNGFFQVSVSSPGIYVLVH